MRKLQIVAAALAVLVLASGCTVVSRAPGPILSLASKDATATLTWIDDQIAAGNLSETDAALAKACPGAVLALNELREKLAAVEAPDGFKGLIYFGTVKKYGDGQRDLVVRGVTEVAASCLPLVSYRRLLGLF